MIICSCHRVSDNDPIKPLSYICGNCKSLINDISVLKQHENIVLGMINDRYVIYRGYKKLSECDDITTATKWFNDLIV